MLFLWGPGGNYDGTFIADYEYVQKSGDLDQCNGTFVLTPDFPRGTYACFLTTNWPFVPRCFAGEPDSSFDMRGQGILPSRGSRPSDCFRRGAPGCSARSGWTQTPAAAALKSFPVCI